MPHTVQIGEEIEVRLGRGILEVACLGGTRAGQKLHMPCSVQQWQQHMGVMEFQPTAGNFKFEGLLRLCVDAICVMVPTTTIQGALYASRYLWATAVTCVLQRGGAPPRKTGTWNQQCGLQSHTW